MRDFDGTNVQERWRQKEDEDKGKKDDECTEDSYNKNNFQNQNYVKKDKSDEKYNEKEQNQRN